MMISRGVSLRFLFSTSVFGSHFWCIFGTHLGHTLGFFGTPVHRIGGGLGPVSVSVCVLSLFVHRFGSWAPFSASLEAMLVAVWVWGAMVVGGGPF